MKPLEAPATLTIYMLLSQSSTSFYFNAASVAGMTGTMGSGIFGTRDEAEKARTLAILSDKSNNTFHVFELEVPNPAYKKTD
jgi:hypothetical protein